MSTTESTFNIEKLILKLPGTKFTCWGLAQSPTASFANELYHGTIDEVDPNNPLKMTIKDGNVIKLELDAIGKGSHRVILNEPAENGKENKANFVCFVTVGYNILKGKPVFLQDYMRELANSKL